jgi:hypothetical protein
MMLLPSCVEPYYAGDMSPRPGGSFAVERQPVVVERRQYIQEQAPVRVERYAPSYRESRPYYGDPAPAATYQRTTTRTYQGY